MTISINDAIFQGTPATGILSDASFLNELEGTFTLLARVTAGNLYCTFKRVGKGMTNPDDYYKVPVGKRLVIQGLEVSTDNGLTSVGSNRILYGDDVQDNTTSPLTNMRAIAPGFPPALAGNQLFHKSVFSNSVPENKYPAIYASVAASGFAVFLMICKEEDIP